MTTYVNTKVVTAEGQSARKCSEDLGSMLADNELMEFM